MTDETHEDGVRASPRVILVKYRPDPRTPRHGSCPKISYQAKIIGANGETEWLDYSGDNKYWPERTARHWADLLGVELEEDDQSAGWGKI